MPASSASRSWTLLMPVISAKDRDLDPWWHSLVFVIRWRDWPPDSVTFHIWTAYSPFTTWGRLSKTGWKRKEIRENVKPSEHHARWDVGSENRRTSGCWRMAERKEHYSAPVPDRVAYLTPVSTPSWTATKCAYGDGGRWGKLADWPADYYGPPRRWTELLRVDEAINKTYTRRNGAESRYPVSAGILAGLTRPLCMNLEKAWAVPGDPH